MKAAYKILSSHNVSRLCHFTRFVTLKHILGSEDGIKARNFVDGLTSRPTDDNRFDREEDFICCSVEYPNTWYLDKVRNSDPIFNEWAILSIDLKALLYRKVKYCECNAAYGAGIYVHDESENMTSLYNNLTIRGRARPQQMLECCPTDGQSEVLVYRNIPRNFINGIILKSESVANQLCVSFKTLGITDSALPQLIISPEMFEKNTWRISAEQGRRVNEWIYGG